VRGSVATPTTLVMRRCTVFNVSSPAIVVGDHSSERSRRVCGGPTHAARRVK
jgi:hypothetical protein